MRRYLLDTGIMGDFIKGWRFERHAGIAARELGDDVSNRDSRVRCRRPLFGAPCRVAERRVRNGLEDAAWFVFVERLQQNDVADKYGYTYLDLEPRARTPRTHEAR